jgi:hypothetical protein
LPLVLPPELPFGPRTVGEAAHLIPPWNGVALGVVPQNINPNLLLSA